MVATEHLCPKHPKGRSWRPGPVAQCPHHDARGRTVPKVKGILSAKEKRAMDRQAGIIGHDDGSGFVRDGSPRG